jgi:class 3 adenylate cyclase
MDPMERRMAYTGPVVADAARITALTNGGQILVSHAAFLKAKEDDSQELDAKRMVCVGHFDNIGPSSGGTPTHNTQRFGGL